MKNDNQTPNALTLLDNAAWVQRLARRLLKDAQLAEDVAQEVLTVGLTAPSSLSANPERFRRWLGGVTRRVASRMRRREGERLSWESQVARAEANESEKAALERLQLHQRLTNAVMELDEPHRSVLVMRFFDDLKPQEIARQLSLPQATVRKRLSRASALLRARLDDEFGGDRQAWGVALLALVEGPRVPAPVAGLSKVLWPVAAVAVAASALLGLELGGRVAAEPEPASVELAVDEPTSQPSVVSTTLATASAPASKRVEVAVSATEANFDLLVVTENGSPIADALVCLVAGEELVASTRSGSSGHAFFNENDTPAQLVVQSSGRPIVVTALDKHAGVQRVILQPGTSVTGRIEVDGTTPRRPLLLSLGWSESPFEPLSTGVFEQLVEQGLRSPFEAVPTAADGAFFFDGVTRDWWGTLHLPRTYWFSRAPDGTELLEGNGNVLVLRGPRQGLKLDATRLPLVGARILGADTGLPLIDANVLIIPLFEGRPNQPLTTVSTDDTGHFALELTDGIAGSDSPFREASFTPALLEVQLDVSAPGYKGVELTLLGSELGPNGEAGDIVLEPSREWRFLIRDSQGQPIPGAMVYGDRVSPPSDRDGLIRFRDDSEGLTSVFVGSPQHRVRSVSVSEWPGGDAAPIEVTLEPGNRLELRLVGSKEAIGGAQVITVSGSVGIYELGHTGYPTRLHNALGATNMFTCSQWSRGHGFTKFLVDGEDGDTLVFLSILPDVLLNVEVLGRQRNVLLSERVVTPRIGESIQLELKLEECPFELSVHVRDEYGLPLRGVSLKLAFGVVEGLLGPKTVSDSEGAGTFSAMYPSASPGLLSAELPGYVPLGIPDIVIAPDTQLPDLVMQPAVAVRVQVQDEDSQPVPVPRVRAQPAGCGPATSRQLEPGVFLVSGLPQQTVLLHIRYGGRDFTLEHDALEPEATFVLPNHGSLWLQLSDTVVIPEHGWLQARLTSLDEVGIEFVVYPEDSSAEEPVPLLPGRYRVQFEHHRQAKDGAPSTQDALGRSHVVEVQAGKRLDFILDDRW